MATLSTTIRLDSELKAQFQSLCKQFGMSLNSAINALIRKSVEEKTIECSESDVQDKARKDFWETFQAMREQASDVPEMTLEEINAEINAYRAERGW